VPPARRSAPATPYRAVEPPGHIHRPARLAPRRSAGSAALSGACRSSDLAGFPPGHARAEARPRPLGPPSFPRATPTFQLGLPCAEAPGPPHLPERAGLATSPAHRAAAPAPKRVRVPLGEPSLPRTAPVFRPGPPRAGARGLPTFVQVPVVRPRRPASWPPARRNTPATPRRTAAPAGDAAASPVRPAPPRRCATFERGGRAGCRTSRGVAAACGERLRSPRAPGRLRSCRGVQLARLRSTPRRSTSPTPPASPDRSCDLAGAPRAARRPKSTGCPLHPGVLSSGLRPSPSDPPRRSEERRPPPSCGRSATWGPPPVRPRIARRRCGPVRTPLPAPDPAGTSPARCGLAAAARLRRNPPEPGPGCTEAAKARFPRPLLRALSRATDRSRCLVWRSGPLLSSRPLDRSPPGLSTRRDATIREKNSSSRLFSPRESVASSRRFRPFWWPDALLGFQPLQGIPLRCLGPVLPPALLSQAWPGAPPAEAGGAPSCKHLREVLAAASQSLREQRSWPVSRETDRPS
jgi:hypothetical protein